MHKYLLTCIHTYQTINHHRYRFCQRSSIRSGSLGWRPSRVRSPWIGSIDWHVCMYWNNATDVCMYVSKYVCMYVSKYVCMYVFMYVQYYVCMYVCVSVRLWYVVEFGWRVHSRFRIDAPYLFYLYIPINPFLNESRYRMHINWLLYFPDKIRSVS
jgi:hypothetical protein